MQGQDVYGISMLSEESKTATQCTSQLAFLSLVELPVPLKNQMCLDPQLNCQKFIDLQMESADAYSPCIVDIDIETDNFEKPKSEDEAVGSIKSEGQLTVSSQPYLCIKHFLTKFFLYQRENLHTSRPKYGSQMFCFIIKCLLIVPQRYHFSIFLCF